MKEPFSVLIAFALVATTTIPLRGQTTATTDQSIQTATDLEVMLQAVEATTPVPASQLPTTGNFYSVQHSPASAEPWPPLPGNVLNLPAWPLGGDFFLLDDTNVDYEALAQPQTATFHQTAPGFLAMDESSGGGFASAFGFATNSLWLQINGVSNAMAHLSLNNATDQVYEVLSKTNLTLTNWTIEPNEVWPTNSIATQFTVSILNRTNALFIRAMDWTGVTENGNTVPDWWFWYYFQTLNLSDNVLDSQGNNTLLYDYQNGVDPNIISFTLSFTNQYVNSFCGPMQLSITAGEPYYIAMLVDNTNYADANWIAYDSSNIVANLGSVEGWHQVYVGLRGSPANAYQTWETVRFKLDLTPPLLVITNPTPGTVTQPVIQLQGYSPETLASISYDLTNAAGLITNQQVLILNQDYSTNTLEFTTNHFQCFDVPLTNGPNAITLHATDWAGNMTTTNFNFTLDYSSDTNPPLVRLDWPQNGTQISGTNFTWRGWVSDSTSQVVAQMVDTNGVTNSVTGRVGRGGSFWIDDLPLSGGMNNLSLRATDAAGNTSVTNINIVQSTVALTITSAGLGQSVTGTISDPANYTIWVNGIMATNNGDGTWIAQDPHLTLDTPTVQVRAIPNSDHGGYGSGGGQ